MWSRSASRIAASPRLRKNLTSTAETSSHRQTITLHSKTNILHSRPGRIAILIHSISFSRTSRTWASRKSHPNIRLATARNKTRNLGVGPPTARQIWLTRICKNLARSGRSEGEEGNNQARPHRSSALAHPSAAVSSRPAQQPCLSLPRPVDPSTPLRAFATTVRRLQWPAQCEAHRSQRCATCLNVARNRKQAHSTSSASTRIPRL